MGMGSKTHAFIFIFALASCSHFKKPGSWGTKAYRNFSWNHVKGAIIKNVTSAHVWAPLSGALISKVSGIDKDIGQRSKNHKVLFSSKEEADTYSDTLNNILEIEMWTSSLFTNSWEEGEGPANYGANKVKGVTVLYLAKGLAHSSTKQLKLATNRERPNDSDQLSFPSGHASKTGTYRMMVSRNLESTDIDPKAKLYLNGATGLMAATSVFSRVSANAHFPSDALAGYAIGSFVSGLVYDILMNMAQTRYLPYFQMKKVVLLLSTH